MPKPGSPKNPGGTLADGEQALFRITRDQVNGRLINDFVAATSIGGTIAAGPALNRITTGHNTR